MRRGVLCMLSVAACGRVGFDSVGQDADGVTLTDAVRTDVGSGTTPAFASVMQAAATSVMMHSVTGTVPDGMNCLMLVSIQISSDCLPPADTTVPAVVSVDWAGSPLRRVIELVGTPCGPGLTRSELWELVAPAAVTSAATIRLSGTARTVHSAAYVFVDVDPVDPIRISTATSGASSLASIAVTSAPAELVFSVVGHGGGVLGPGPGQTTIHVTNVDATNTLNNSAASYPPGASSLSMSWRFPVVDEWQLFVLALR